jgi:hypothetical protein
MANPFYFFRRLKKTIPAKEDFAFALENGAVANNPVVVIIASFCTVIPDVLDNPLHAVPDTLSASGRARLDLPDTVLVKKRDIFFIDL